MVSVSAPAYRLGQPGERYLVSYSSKTVVALSLPTIMWAGMPGSEDDEGLDGIEAPLAPVVNCQ